MQVAPTQSRSTRTAGAIVAAAVAVVLAGGAGAFAAVQLTSPPDAGSSASGVAPTLVVESTPTSIRTPTPTPATTTPAGDSASGDGGSTGGTDSGSSGGSSGSSGGDVTPPPPPPPPAEPPFTDADARAAVLNWYPMAVPVYGLCGATNYGTFGNHSAPPPPVYVGVLGYDAGALPDGSGGWVKWYSCE